jgi:hemoglobin/transferrin/lactoferrin receptor protein
MKLRYFFTLLLYILFSVNFLTVAQETNDSLPLLELQEIVITANRHGSFRIETPEAIRVVEIINIGKFQLRTAPEAMMMTPGVFVQKTNHGGGSPFIRGLTGNQTLIVLDGIRLSNAVVRYGPNQYFNTIDIFNTEKMEVLRGGGAVQYGSDAIGGTIQAFSYDLKTSEKPVWKNTTLTRIGTHGMEKSLHSNVRYSNSQSSFRGGITLRNFGDLVGGDTTSRQAPTGYNEKDFDFKGKVLLSSNSDLTFLYQNVTQDDVPVYHKIALENYEVNRMNPQKRQLAYLRFQKELGEGLFRSATITGSFQKNNEIRESKKKNSSVLRTESDKVRTLGLTAEVLAGKRKWNSISGFEFYNDFVSSLRNDYDDSFGVLTAKRGLYPDGAAMTGIGVFTIHDFEAGKWNVNTGIRYNTYINKVNDESLGVVKLKPNAVVGSLSILRKLTSRSNLFISLSNGFRTPNIDDLGTLGIVDFRYETPNFNLKPERSLQYQTGYKYQNQRIRGEIYLYRNELYNLIVRNMVPGDTIEGYPVYRKDNIDRAYIQGIESSLEIELSPHIFLSGNITTTLGRNITKEEPLRRIPPAFGRVSLEYNPGKWWINLELLAAGKQDKLAAGDKEDNRIPAGGTPGWSIINLQTGFSVGFAIIDVSFLNLLDLDYRYHGSGVNGTGRSAFITLRFNL